MINWHRLFGLALADYFTDTGYQVEMEKEVARKRQLLDIVIIRAGGGPPLAEPCAGLEHLRPHNLLKEGVYTVRALSRPITVIVLKDVPTATRNALWALFSFEAARVAQGARDYVWRQADHVSLLQELYHRYQHVGIAMSYTFADFERDLARRLVLELPPEERLRGLPPEERLRGLSEEELQRLRQLLDTQLKH